MSISLYSIPVSEIIFSASSVSDFGVISVSGIIIASVFSFRFLLQMYVRTAESTPPLNPKINPLAFVFLISSMRNTSIFSVILE